MFTFYKYSNHFFLHFLKPELGAVIIYSTLYFTSIQNRLSNRISLCPVDGHKNICTFVHDCLILI